MEVGNRSDVVNLAQQKKYDIQYSVSDMYKVLSRVGLSWGLVVASIHPQADLEAQ